MQLLQYADYRLLLYLKNRKNYAKWWNNKFEFRENMIFWKFVCLILGNPYICAADTCMVRILRQTWSKAHFSLPIYPIFILQTSWRNEKWILNKCKPIAGHKVPFFTSSTLYSASSTLHFLKAEKDKHTF